MSAIEERTKETPVEATLYLPDRGETADEAKRFLEAAHEGIVLLLQVKSPSSGDWQSLEALEGYVKSLQKTIERLTSQQRTLERLLEVLTSEEGPPTPAAVLQIRRNVEARKKLFDEFGAFTGSEIAELAGSTAENRSATANRWRQEQRIFGVRHHDALFYPGFQFGDDGRPLPVVREVLKLFSSQGLTDWETALWFTAPTSSLRDQRPVDLMREDPDAVVEAARHEVAPVSG